MKNRNQNGNHINDLRGMFPGYPPNASQIGQPRVPILFSLQNQHNNSFGNTFEKSHLQHELLKSVLTNLHAVFEISDSAIV